ncbi:MAG: hypothetical protein ACI32N_04485 [Bulleidia sp.]
MNIERIRSKSGSVQGLPVIQPAVCTQTISSNGTYTSNEETIEWVYEIHDGTIRRRLYNYTTVEWIGTWEEGMRSYTETELQMASDWVERRYQGCEDDGYVIRDGGGFSVCDSESAKKDIIRQIEEKGHRAEVMTVSQRQLILENF